MNYAKPGYSFIEITAGIFLSSLLAISLFQSVRNTTSTVKLADDLMDLDMRVATFHHQFSRDSIGIFVPDFQVLPQQPEQPQPILGQPASPALALDALKPEQKKLKSFDSLFYSINADNGNVSEFTFITTNPVRVYDKAVNVTKSPRMVRVMYRLLKDPKKEDTYTLFRQESPELEVSTLNANAEKPVRAYALLSNIKKMKIEFSYPVKREQTQEQKQAAPVQGQKPPVKQEAPSQALPEIEKFIKRSDWPFKTPEEAQEKQVPLSAQLLTVSFELWDDAHAGSRTFELQYPIASFTLAAKKQKKRKPAIAPKQSPPATPGKPGAPGAPGTQGIKTGRRLEETIALKPSTQNKLETIGQKMFKFTFEETKKEVASKPKSDEQLLKELEQFLNSEKGAS